MTSKYMKTAEAYYLAMGEKDVSQMENLLHPEVEFIAPLAKTHGKEALLKGAQMFTTLFNTLKIHRTFESNDSAVVIYDLECPKPIGNLRAVAFMNFTEDLISRVELFYDPRPFLNS